MTIGLFRARNADVLLWGGGALLASGLAVGLASWWGEAGVSVWLLPAVVAGAVVVAWLATTRRYEVALLAILLYLACVDGPVKMLSASSNVTLIRDVLLYALVAGVFVRWAIGAERFPRPPMLGLVLTFIGVVLVQVLNPAGVSVGHSVESIRQHLEFVPLLFFGFLAMRSVARLRAFLLVLLLAASANGVAGLVQARTEGKVVASWGPGYDRLVNGSNFQTSRTFLDATRKERVRPPALGSDFGFGGAVGELAIPGGLALLTLAGRRRRGTAVLAALLTAGATVAVVTAQARTAVVATVIGILMFAMLSVVARSSGRALVSIGAALAIGFAVIPQVAASVAPGTFKRYETIKPEKVVDTTIDYRRDTIALIPTYVRDYPLGAGIGRAGPAGSRKGEVDVAADKLSAESQITFLILELGVPGLIAYLAIYFVTLSRALFGIRLVADRETRLLLAAIVAPLFSTAATWVVGIGSATTPGAPYFWFSAGVLAYWLPRVSRRAA